jgi:hypothetical protein
MVERYDMPRAALGQTFFAHFLVDACPTRKRSYQIPAACPVTITGPSAYPTTTRDHIAPGKATPSFSNASSIERPSIMILSPGQSSASGRQPLGAGAAASVAREQRPAAEAGGAGGGAEMVFEKPIRLCQYGLANI